MLKIATAYGLPSFKISDHTSMREHIRDALTSDGPVLVDVVLDPMQPFFPKVASERKADGRMVSKPLEDMYPFLSGEEFLSNMIIPPWEPEK